MSRPLKRLRSEKELEIFFPQDFSLFVSLPVELQCHILSFVNSATLLSLKQTSFFFRLFRDERVQEHFKILFTKELPDVLLYPSMWILGWACQRENLCLYCNSSTPGREQFYRVSICSRCYQSHDIFRLIGMTEAYEYGLNRKHLESIKKYINFTQKYTIAYYRLRDVKQYALKLYGSEELIEEARQKREKRLNDQHQRRRLAELNADREYYSHYPIGPRNPVNISLLDDD